MYLCNVNKKIRKISNKMYKKTVSPKKAKVTTRVCSGCIKDFDAKFLFVGQMVDYTTLFCQKCIDELKIEVVRPYYKVKEVKEKVVEEKIVPKTKKTTTSKTKKTTSKTTKKSSKTNEEEKS